MLLENGFEGLEICFFGAVQSRPLGYMCFNGMKLFAGVAVVICKNTFAARVGSLRARLVFLLLKREQLFLNVSIRVSRAATRSGAFLMRADGDGCDMWQ